MNINLTIPLVVAAAGGIMYGFSNGKASEIGKLCFGCGLLAFLLTLK